MGFRYVPVMRNGRAEENRAESEGLGVAGI
jgi:hypothetical protein